MSDHSRWEDRYRRDHDTLPPPSAFLRGHIDALPVGRALDVACGGGRHAIFLARRGFAVDTIDVAYAGLVQVQRIARAERLPITLVQADLETFPLARGRYSLVVNSRYLQRSLWPGLKTALRPGGVLLFETFLIDQQTIGHPKNPAFLLAPNELRRAFADFEILHYEEGLARDDGDPAYLARLLARRPRVRHA